VIWATAAGRREGPFHALAAYYVTVDDHRPSRPMSDLAKSLYAYTIYAASLTPVILAAFFWKRATAAAAVASIATGTAVTVCWDTAFVRSHLPATLAASDAIFPALLASLLCLFIVSFFTAPPSSRQLEPFGEA